MASYGTPVYFPPELLTKIKTFCKRNKAAGYTSISQSTIRLWTEFFDFIDTENDKESLSEG